ncbi:hypothetical protein, partial [Micromonospora sp. LOL_023]|uniref:hypothetical protein n=1 Tax=Micromonospora sp. LOL_023 TaxID=3345418 RepID=UPI003A864698
SPRDAATRETPAHTHDPLTLSGIGSTCGLDIQLIDCRMSLSDADPLLVAARLVLTFCGLLLIVLGVHTAVTRRSPLSRLRFVRPTMSQRSLPVRNGGCQALLGAGLLIQQVPFLVPVPHWLGTALFAVALLVVFAALGWFILVRRQRSSGTVSRPGSCRLPDAVSGEATRFHRDPVAG